LDKNKIFQSKGTLFLVFSNTTQFETALPMLICYGNMYDFIAIFNLSNKEYSQGLERYLQTYQSKFIKIFTIYPSKTRAQKIIQLIKVKSFVKDSLYHFYIKASIQFIEGGDIDWLVIGVFKENNIKTIVMQWAITWEPSYYDNLKQSKRINIRPIINKIIKIMLGLNYPTMKYLGDGQADYLLTMGEFWTNQFLKYHNYPDKFIATGNPRFLDLIDLKGYPNKQNILFITGAGTSLYGYSKNNHLKDIEEVYLAYQKSGISNETQKATTELLKTTLITIIIRSTVGLEALISGSKLIVYNNNKQLIGFNYAKHNLAKEAKNIKELTYLLKNHESIDRPKENKIEYYIKTSCLKIMKVLIDLKKIK